MVALFFERRAVLSMDDVGGNKNLRYTGLPKGH